MLRATQVEAGDDWQGIVCGAVELDAAGRRRRRYKMSCTNGIEFLLDLETAPHLHHGNKLVLSDGRRIEVIAAPEQVTEITAPDSTQLIALAYHLGNRHLEAQILPDRILIRPDHVIEAMIKGLGGKVLHVARPFEPVAGAYAGDSHNHHRHE